MEQQLQQLRPQLQLQLQPLVVVAVVVVVVAGRQKAPLMLRPLRLRVGAQALISAVGCCHSLVVGALTLLAVVTSAGCWLTLELRARKTRVAACQRSSILVAVTMTGLCRAV